MLGRSYSRFFSNTVNLPVPHSFRMLLPLNLNKAPSFLKLLQYHKKNRLKTHQILSAPRSGSTLSFRALAQIKQITHHDHVSGAIFEPFLNRKNISWEEKLEHSARIILERAELLGIHQRPVTLLMKEIVSYLPIEIMQHWQAVVDNFIFLIDDPHKQMYSFLQMLANGRKFGLNDPHGNPLVDCNNDIIMHTEAEARARWPAITEMLAEKDFRQTGWEHLTKLVELVTAHCDQSTHKKMVIVDASILKLTPEMTLSDLTKKLNHCTYSPEMVSEWKNTAGKLFFHPNAPSYDPVGSDGVSRSMWIKPALHATTFTLPAVSHPTEIFPPKLVNHLIQVALPAYNSLMSHPAFLLPTDIAALIEKGSTTCPVTLIALLKILIDINNERQQPDRQLLLYYESIVQKNPTLLTAFIALANSQGVKSESTSTCRMQPLTCKA